MNLRTTAWRRLHRLLEAAPLVVTLLLAGCTTSIDVYLVGREASSPGSYPIVGTGQQSFWGTDGREMTAPAKDEVLYGQDAQRPGTTPSYRDNGDGTVSDLVTGQMWTKSLDLNGDGTINAADKRSLVKAAKGSSAITVEGYSDWRLPTIKELYLLIDFSGTDVRTGAPDARGSIRFIDTGYFDFGYGDIGSGDRIIDARCTTSTLYVDKTFLVFETMFGVNFADGRIKGYPLCVSMQGLGESDFYVYYVRGNLAYGVNDFKDNGDGTITDNATGLKWSKADSGEGMDWEEALAWVQAKNAGNYLGHSDWRLPDIKELQSIVDYSRSPATTNSSASGPIPRWEIPATTPMARDPRVTQSGSTISCSSCGTRSRDQHAALVLGKRPADFGETWVRHFVVQALALVPRPGGEKAGLAGLPYPADDCRRRQATLP